MGFLVLISFIAGLLIGISLMLIGQKEEKDGF